MPSPEQTFINRMGLVAEADGLPRIGGRLFALLILSDQPRSLDDLADTLGVSKASISTEARRLVDKGIAERVARTGDRRDYYAIAPDFFHRLIAHRIARWSQFGALVGDCRDQLGDESATIARRLDDVLDLQQAVVRAASTALDEAPAARRRPALARRRSAR